MVQNAWPLGWPETPPAPSYSLSTPEPETRPLWLRPKREFTRTAATTLFLFALIHAAALLAWFTRVQPAWTYKSLIALASTVAALGAGAALWRTPSQAWVRVGLAAVALSLLRIGPPDEWTTMSAVVFEVTILLLIPLARAAIAFRRVAL